MGLFGRSAFGSSQSGSFRYNEADSSGFSLFVNPDAAKRNAKWRARQENPRTKAKDDAKARKQGAKVLRDIEKGKYGKGPWCK